MTILYSIYPYGCSPSGLHGKGDKAGDGIGNSEVENQIVNVGPAPDNEKQGIFLVYMSLGPPPSKSCDIISPI